MCQILKKKIIFQYKNSLPNMAVSSPENGQRTVIATVIKEREQEQELIPFRSRSTATPRVPISAVD